MKNFAVIAATAILLTLAGAAGAQELTGNASSNGTDGSSAPLTARPGEEAPAGTTTTFVPPPSHPAEGDVILNSSEATTDHAPKTHGGTLGKDTGHNTGKSGAADDADQNYKVNINSAAQDTSVDAYDENGEPYGNQYYQASPANMQVSLLHPPGLQPGQVELHLSSTMQLTSCIHISSLPHMVKYSDDGDVTVTLKRFTIDMRGLNDDPGYNCHQATVPTPTADVVLDRDDLRKRGTKHIEIVSDGGTTDRYDVILTDHQIRMQPSKEGGGVAVALPARPTLVRNPLQHWFYPAGTVILYVPGVPHGHDINDELEHAARARGLTPLTELWPEFKSPLTQPQLHYYVDKDDKVLKGVPNGEGTVVGSVTIDKTVYGLQGDEIEKKDLPIYGRAPNTYE